MPWLCRESLFVGAAASAAFAVLITLVYHVSSAASVHACMHMQHMERVHAVVHGCCAAL